MTWLHSKSQGRISPKVREKFVFARWCQQGIQVLTYLQYVVLVRIVCRIDANELAIVGNTIWTSSEWASASQSGVQLMHAIVEWCHVLHDKKKKDRSSRVSFAQSIDKRVCSQVIGASDRLFPTPSSSIFDELSTQQPSAFYPSEFGSASSSRFSCAQKHASEKGCLRVWFK